MFSASYAYGADDFYIDLEDTSEEYLEQAKKYAAHAKLVAITVLNILDEG